jgi:hypothetical protein
MEIAIIHILGGTLFHGMVMSSAGSICNTDRLSDYHEVLFVVQNSYISIGTGKNESLGFPWNVFCRVLWFLCLQDRCCLIYGLYCEKSRCEEPIYITSALIILNGLHVTILYEYGRFAKL